MADPLDFVPDPFQADVYRASGRTRSYKISKASARWLVTVLPGRRESARFTDRRFDTLQQAIAFCNEYDQGTPR